MDAQRYNTWIPLLKEFFDHLAKQKVKKDRHSMSKLPIELTNNTGTRLDRLNENCLLQIFSQRSLSPMDLLALTETCTLFQRIAQRAFPKKLTVGGRYSPNFYIFYIKSNDYQEDLQSAHDLERIFQHFGACLVALSVCGCAHEVLDELNLVAMHCVGTLKELEIDRIEITAVLALELAPIFRQLQKFTIHDATIECDANGFAKWDSLVELNVVGLFKSKAILDNYFPKLQRFTFEERLRSSDSVYILNFLERHDTLKCIHLAVRFVCENEQFFQILGNNCKELEELQTLCRYEATLDLSNYHNVKRLRLDCHEYDKMPPILQLQEMRSLEVLNISGHFDCSQLSEDLQLLTNLRELNLNLAASRQQPEWISLPHGIDNVVDIVRHLRNLQELKIFTSNFVLKEEELDEIVNVVKERKNVLTLTCRFKFSQSSESYKKICDGSSKVKLIKFVK